MERRRPVGRRTQGDACLGGQCISLLGATRRGVIRRQVVVGEHARQFVIAERLEEPGGRDVLGASVTLGQ